MNANGLAGVLSAKVFSRTSLVRIIGCRSGKAMIDAVVGVSSVMSWYQTHRLEMHLSEVRCLAFTRISDNLRQGSGPS
jgi:hypothetical protein